MDNLNQLFFGIGFLILMRCDINQVRADMVFKYYGQQTVHGASTPGDLLKHIHAAALLDQGAFNCLNLTSDAPYPVQELLLIANSMAHTMT